MISIDRARAALATGLLALWMGFTNAMLKYLRPSMRPWLVTAGVGLTVMGIYGVVRARHLQADADDHPHGKNGSRTQRVGWLLVVPVVAIILFGPQPMGQFALTRTPHLPDYAFDIAGYATSKNESIPKLKMSDFLEGETEPGNRPYLDSHDVTLRGFVSFQSVAGPGSFVLTRYLISCCAADAQPLSVTIIGAGTVPDKSQWLDVTARFDPVATAQSNGKYGPVLRLSKLTAISTPSGPYETLR